MFMHFRGGGVGHKSTCEATNQFLCDRDLLDLNNSDDPMGKMTPEDVVWEGEGVDDEVEEEMDLEEDDGSVNSSSSSSGEEESEEDDIDHEYAPL
jgi:hypothetical protein